MIFDFYLLLLELKITYDEAYTLKCLNIFHLKLNSKIA